ncbi:MAG: dTMP kinase [Candidatus Omnitrophica bacterium]|nr:dTMP kinase [Candidatus Omnitrophota bacterium]
MENRTMKKALFITVEGLEGSGKSSVIGYLEKFFRVRGAHCTVFREPGSTRVGEKIRQLLLDKKNSELSRHTELLLYLAARTQLIEEKLTKVFGEADVIISDRFFDSTLVYQGYALGLGRIVERAVAMFTLGVVPDITFLLDVHPSRGLARIRDKDRIESRPLSFHRKLRKGYLTLAKKYPGRIAVINAEGTLDEIYMQVEKVLRKKIGRA